MTVVVFLRKRSVIEGCEQKESALPLKADFGTRSSDFAFGPYGDMPQLAKGLLSFAYDALRPDAAFVWQQRRWRCKLSRLMSPRHGQASHKC
jgi:hypothetical protein